MTPQPQSRGLWTSASNAAADALCPGRHLAQAGILESRGADAESGTLIHLALAIQDSTGLTLEQQEVYDACQEIDQRESAKLFAQLGEGQPKVTREQREWVRFKDASGREIAHSGQYDVLRRAGVCGLITDYKTLQGDTPESPRNMQLRDLVVLVARKPGALLKSIAVMVVQPLVTHTPEITIYEEDDINKAEQEMLVRVAASNNPASKRVAGEVQCKFCLAKRRCPEYQQFAGAMVPGVQSLLSVPVEQWTPAQRGVFLDKRSVAQKWLDDCEAAMKAGLAKDPAFADGWALAPGRTRETITDAQAAFERFCKLGGTAAQFLSTVSVGKSKLKEAINAVTGAKGKQLDETVKQLCDGISETSTNAPMLKKLEDA